ncbi:MAG: hypothetical protein ACOCZL_02755 [Bacteroidota bacterium]
MSKIPLLLLAFICFPCFPQSASDSVVSPEILRNIRNDLHDVTRNYKQLEDAFETNARKNQSELEILFREDSIKRLVVNELNLKIDSLRTALLHTREIFFEENEKCKQEIFHLRKTRLRLIIVLLSLLLINFLYLLYRNFQLKLYLDKELINTSVKIERKHNKLRKKLKEKFRDYSVLMDKRYKKWKRKRK